MGIKVGQIRKAIEGLPDDGDLLTIETEGLGYRVDEIDAEIVGVEPAPDGRSLLVTIDLTDAEERDGEDDDDEAGVFD